MSLAPTLRARQSQRLAMTPQLRHAIGLLALDNRGLSDSLRKASEVNPCIAYRPLASGEVIDQLAAAPGSLAAHMTQQIRLCFDRKDELAIAFALLGSLEPWGWLGRPLGEIALECGQDQACVEIVLRRLQEFEPAGVFARDLSECLALQADDLGHLDPAMRTLLDHLELIAAGEMDQLAHLCGCGADGLAKRLAILRRLDPKPGLQLQAAPPVHAAADLLITREGTSWQVTLNPASQTEIEVLPGLDAETRRNAERLRRAVDRRNSTVLTVARHIVSHQAGYLAGAAHPAPLTLSQLAGETGRHESTISRVTAALTAQTPRGVLPLRALLGRGLRGSRAHGKAISVAELEARIAALINAENPARPLSDARLTALLGAEGITVQRRTVAKYRAALGFSTAHKRRRTAGPKEPGATSTPNI